MEVKEAVRPTFGDATAWLKPWVGEVQKGLKDTDSTYSSNGLHYREEVKSEEYAVELIEGFLADLTVQMVWPEGRLKELKNAIWKCFYGLREQANNDGVLYIEGFQASRTPGGLALFEDIEYAIDDFLRDKTTFQPKELVEFFNAYRDTHHLDRFSPEYKILKTTGARLPRIALLLAGDTIMDPEQAGEFTTYLRNRIGLLTDRLKNLDYSRSDIFDTGQCLEAEIAVYEDVLRHCPEEYQILQKEVSHGRTQAV